MILLDKKSKAWYIAYVRYDNVTAHSIAESITTMNAPINYDQFTRDQLIDMIELLRKDNNFGGIMNRNAAMLFMSCIEAGKTAIMIDIANMHGLNHAYTMNGADQLISNVIAQFRHSDTIIRWGGDELIVILNSGCVKAYIDRFMCAMNENNMYAVYSVVTTSNNLEETVNRLDTLCMGVKLDLEKRGLKADRNAEYSVLDSHVVYE